MGKISTFSTIALQERPQKKHVSTVGVLEEGSRAGQAEVFGATGTSTGVYE